jgi:hypothetical protein
MEPKVSHESLSSTSRGVGPGNAVCGQGSVHFIAVKSMLSQQILFMVYVLVSILVHDRAQADWDQISHYRKA